MKSNAPCVLLWFRRDLRLCDNKAVSLALKHHLPVIPLYIWDDLSEGECAQLWLHEALTDLKLQLGKIKSHLVVERGNPEEVFQELISKLNIKAVFWNKSYDAGSYEEEDRIKKLLRKLGIDVFSLDSCLLSNPDSVMNKKGEPYKVFTPYYKALRSTLKVFEDLPDFDCSVPLNWPESESIDDLDLVEPWGKDVISNWNATREGAEDALNRFIENALIRYAEDRDFPAIQGTSRLSPYLHIGQLGPREVYNAIQKSSLEDEIKEVFIRQLIWREFAYYILHHFPQLPICSLDNDFERYPWSEDRKMLLAWRKGQTGYPLVDAAMRQLWKTGWMHNRLRMLVGSFLVKDLIQDWRHGYRWFMNTLLDADIACNGFGWQWVAGCGCDASPYFRVFNPYRQSMTFDPSGDFIRKYVPELKALPDKWIHCPSEAPTQVLKDANIILGETYPHILVPHQQARDQALNGYYMIKGKRENGNRSKTQ